MRYVDDYLGVFEKVCGLQEAGKINEVMGVFNGRAKGLTFTGETAEQGRLIYFDLVLPSEGGRTCWNFEPREKKGLLPYDCFHSKISKRGIVLSYMRAALHKSWIHRMSASLANRVSRLEKVRCPGALL